MLNLWYIAAIMLGAAAAFCGYYGSVVQGRRDSELQAARIESQLQTLGSDIQELRKSGGSPLESAKLKEANEKYKELAEEFFESVDVKAAKEKARSAQEQVAEVQKAQQVQAYFADIVQNFDDLAAAYNDSADQALIQIQDQESQRSQNHPDHLLVKFGNDRYWAVRKVTHDAKIPGIELLRVVSSDGSSNYDSMRLTSDSMIILFLNDLFRVSVHQGTSEAVRVNVTDGLNLSQQPIDQLGPLATELVRRIIEYELLILRS